MMSTQKKTQRYTQKQQYARKYAEQINTQCSDTLFHMMGRDEIDVDLATISKGDLLIVLHMIVSCPTFKRIRIHSPNNSNVENTNTIRRHQSTRIIDQTTFVPAILRGILRSKTIEHLELDGVSEAITKKLASVLKNTTKSIKSLRILNVFISTKSFVKIIQALMSSNVSQWQFCGCGLTCEIKHDLRNLISIHHNRRACSKWQYELRGDSHNPQQEGILSLDVSRNALGDETVAELAKVLQDDPWILSINLAHNGLTATSAELLLHCMNSNSTILCLTLNDQKISDEVINSLQSHLDSNRAQSKVSQDIIDRFAPIVKLKRVKNQSSKTVSKKNSLNVRIPSSEAKDTSDHLNSFVADVTGVEEMLVKVMNDLKEHEAAQSIAQARIEELECDNSRLQNDLCRSKSLKTKRKKIRKYRRKSKSGSSIKKKTVKVDDSTNVQEINELVVFLESLFKRLHSYMDELEISNANTNLSKRDAASISALTEKIKNSSSLFETVAGRIQEMNTDEPQS